MPHLELWIEDKARQRLVREMDPIQSEWPAYQASLFGSAANGFIDAVGSGSGSMLISVPSSRWFKPRTLWLWNGHSQNNILLMYLGGSGGSCSATIGQIHISPLATEFIALDAITVDEDIFVSVLRASLGVRIAGILLDSGPQ